MALAADERRIQRCVWIAVRLVRRGRIDYRMYERHFSASSRSYYRDLSTLQRIGIEIQSQRDHGTVILVKDVL
jgi:predicted DNA-binding transcriptional regulator YafY